MEQIIVIGDGDLAKNICEFPGVLGYVDPKELKHVLSVETGEPIAEIGNKTHKAVIGISDPFFRKESAGMWKAKGNEFATLIHTESCVSRFLTIGEGSVVFPYTFIDRSSVIGKHVFIGPQSAIHLSKLGDYSHITLGVKVFMAEIGEGAFLGSASVILENRKVGDYSVVGAGSVVCTDIPPFHKLIQKSTHQTITPVEKSRWTQKSVLSKKNS